MTSSVDESIQYFSNLGMKIDKIAKLMVLIRCWISLVLVGKITLECFLIAECGLQIICKDIV